MTYINCLHYIGGLKNNTIYFLIHYFTSIPPRFALPLYTANFMFQKLCLYFFQNNHTQHTHKNKPILQTPTRKTQIRKKWTKIKQI